MNKILASAAIGLAIVAGAATAAPADARQRGYSVSAQGPHGRGYVRSRHISRQPGAVSASRSFQTNSGRGYSSSRGATWGDGRYSGGATHVLNDGRSFGRSTTIIDNGDGTYNYSRSRTGPNGGSRASSGTVTRPPR